MQKYQNNVQDRAGNAIYGATVTVLNYPSNTVATIYSDNGVTALANPFTTDKNGDLAFYAADGLYTISITAVGILPRTYTAVQLFDAKGDGAPFVTSADLANVTDPAKGAALVGAQDGASGSLWATVSGFIAKIISSTGSSVIGFIQAGTGAVMRSLQDKARDLVNAKDFGAKGDGIQDDGPAIQLALNSISGGGKLELIQGANHRIATPINWPGSNVTLDGKGATLTSDLPVTTDISTTNTVIQNTNTTKITGLTLTADVAVGDAKVSLSSASGVSVGDFVFVQTSTSDPIEPAIKLGIYQRIVAIAGNDVYFGFGVADAITAASVTNVWILSPVENVTIRNLTIRLKNNGGGTAISLYRLFNTKVENVRVYSGGNFGLVGIGLQGVKILVDRCYADSILDVPRLSYGYGVVLSGHDLTVRNSQFYNCKHGVATGGGTFVSTDMLYEGNLAIACTGTSFDVHTGCLGSKFVNNVVYFATSAGIWTRSRSSIIRGNILIATNPTSSPVGIKLIESANSDISVIGNKISGVLYGIFIDSDSPTVTSVRIEQNDITSTGWGIASVRCKTDDLSIKNNRIIAGGYGVQLSEGYGIAISGNKIDFASSQYGIGILFGNLTTPITNNYSDVEVFDNRIERKGATGSACVRFFIDAIGAFKMRDNQLINTYENPFSIAAGTVFASTNNVGGNIGTDIVAAPVANARYVKSQVLTNSAPTIGQPPYRVCTQTGQYITTAIARNTAYGLGQVRYNALNVYSITTAGTTAASPPTFPTTIGATVTDGTAVWTCIDTLATFASAANLV